MSVYYILLSHITIWWHSGRLIYYMIGQASCLMAAISLNHWPSSCTCGVCSVLWCLNLLLPINLQVYPYNGRSPKLVHFGDMEVPSDFRTSHLYTSHCSITFVDAETLCFHSLVHVGSTIARRYTRRNGVFAAVLSEVLVGSVVIPFRFSFCPRILFRLFVCVFLGGANTSIIPSQLIKSQ